MPKNPDEYPYPVFHTQGGGLVREVGERMIFVERPPDFPNIDIGDEIPAEWGIHAANQLAHDRAEEWHDLNIGAD